LPQPGATALATNSPFRTDNDTPLSAGTSLPATWNGWLMPTTSGDVIDIKRDN